MAKRHALADEQWELVEPMVPRKAARTGRPPADRRLMLDAALWVLCTGAPRRDLPERFGPWQTAYDYFAAWRRGGVVAGVMEALQLVLDDRGLIDMEAWCVDGTSVRAARAAAGAAAGASKKAAATPASRRTTRWAGAAAGSGRRSTSRPAAAGPRSRSR